VGASEREFEDGKLYSLSLFYISMNTDSQTLLCGTET
jgi:hypothetical protein